MITQFVELERTPAEPWTSRELRQLSRDAALTLAEWHHHAILELTRLTSFRPDVRWISRVLDVPVDVVNVAITRLTRLGLLDMRSETSWVDAAGDADARRSRTAWSVSGARSPICWSTTQATATRCTASSSRSFP